MPTVELVRGNNICHRRLTIRGHDGSLHPFAVQHPTGGKVRREERIVQLFRIFNQTLFKRKEARRRNLYFHLPIFIPIAPHIRLVQDDSSYVTLQTVYEDFVRKASPAMSRDDPMLFLLEKSRTIAEQQKDYASHGRSIGYYEDRDLQHYPRTLGSKHHRAQLFQDHLLVLCGLLALPTTVRVPICVYDVHDLRDAYVWPIPDEDGDQ